MHKYSFLVHHKDFDGFLEDLMELGMVEISAADSERDEITVELNRRIGRSEQIRKRLESRSVKRVEGLVEEWGEDELGPGITEVLDLEEELERIQHRKVLCENQIEELMPFGDFDWDSVRRLEKEAGLKFRFYGCQQRKFDPKWLEEYPGQIISRLDGRIYFVIVEREESHELPILQLSLPSSSVRDLKRQMREDLSREREIEFTLDEYAANYLDWLRKRIAMRQDHLEYVKARRAGSQLEKLGLVNVQGWCPANRREELEHYLQKEGIVYLLEEPAEDEKPPVLLQNNRFARLFEPIGQLFSLPAYAELDLTAYFAPFFLLFFGFCLGDAGYGLVMLLATTLYKSRVSAKMRPMMTLGQFFGLSTVVFGILSGTFFGMELVKIESLARYRSIFLDQQQLLSLALILGAVQIIFGIGVRAYKNIRFFGWMHGLSPIGWILLLLSLADIAVTKVIPGVSAITVWLGVAMVVIFGSPGKKWPVSVGLGLADLYNITGVVGDLMSYIRLFALGVSSAILGLVVNSIAQQALGIPGFGPVLFILLLVIGHTGNLLLATLSAFVHPLRLTFVEFYKNAEFSGGGHQYKPFAKRVKDAKVKEFNT